MGIALALAKIEGCDFHQKQDNHFFYQKQTTFRSWPLSDLWPFEVKEQKIRFNPLCLYLGSCKWCGGERCYCAIKFTRKNCGHCDTFEKCRILCAENLCPRATFHLKTCISCYKCFCVAEMTCWWHIHLYLLRRWLSICLIEGQVTVVAPS